MSKEHYKEINHHYAEECSQDDIGTFLFTSESVGEGHPGTVDFKMNLIIFGCFSVMWHF